MLRVVFDTRIDVNGSFVVARLDKRICPQDLHMADATIGGYPVVKLVSIEEIESPVCPRRTTRRRTRPKVDDSREQALYTQLCRRVTASKYVILFEPALEVLAKDLEWDLAIRRAGFRGTPFYEMWEKFKASTLKTFWFSRNTRNMIRRMGREDWLAPHITPKE